jgi:hypothetical protein
MNRLTSVEGLPGEGRVPATTKSMGDDEAEQVARLIIDFCFSIARARLEKARQR